MKHFLLQPEYRKWFNEAFYESFIGTQAYYALFYFFCMGGVLLWGFGNGKMFGIENKLIVNNRFLKKVQSPLLNHISK